MKAILKLNERESKALALLLSNLKALDEILSAVWIDKKLHSSHTAIAGMQVGRLNERSGPFQRQNERRRLADEFRHSFEVVVRIEIVGSFTRFRKRPRWSGPNQHQCRIVPLGPAIHFD